MAGQIQRNVRSFPWMTPGGGRISQVGMSADEVKLQQGLVAKNTPATSPIAQRGPVEFLQPTTSSDSLRLAVPSAANPYATPTGPKHDHMMVRQALGRSHSDTSRALVSALKAEPAGIRGEEVGRMKSSLSREHAMLTLLQDVQEMQEMIYGMIIGSQEA